MREKILDAAIELFSKLGLRNVTMDDIARQVGISKKTLYEEFSDKKALVKMGFERLLGQDLCLIEALSGEKEEDWPIKTLMGISRMMRERLQSINPITILEAQKYFPEAWQVFLRHKEEVIYGKLIEILEKGKDLGYFREEIQAQILARVRVDQISSLMDPSKFQDDSYDLVNVQLEMMDHFLHGIFTEKGRQAYYAHHEKTTLNPIK